ncbi:hypothetical protein N9030_00545 [bacterium]|nr:hypothetical protein [bacterium]
MAFRDTWGKEIDSTLGMLALSFLHGSPILSKKSSLCCAATF